MPAERHVKVYPCCPEPYPGKPRWCWLLIVLMSMIVMMMVMIMLSPHIIFLLSTTLIMLGIESCCCFRFTTYLVKSFFSFCLFPIELECPYLVKSGQIDWVWDIRSGEALSVIQFPDWTEDETKLTFYSKILKTVGFIGKRQNDRRRKNAEKWQSILREGR